MRPLCFTAALLSGLMLFACSTRPRPAPPSRAEAPMAVQMYQQGVAEAIQRIRNGNPVIYVAGLAPPGGTDPATGLPYEAIGGCAIDSLTFWRMQGHNDMMIGWFGGDARDGAP